VVDAVIHKGVRCDQHTRAVDIGIVDMSFLVSWRCVGRWVGFIVLSSMGAVNVRPSPRTAHLVRITSR
jgi:hypothetical protein